MTRAVRMVCAAAVLSAALGCASGEFFSLAYLQSTASGRDRVVAGSLESVSTSAQASLRQLGLTAVVTPEGEGLRIASTTRSGETFFLVLTREKSAQGEQTRVRIEWEGTPDDQTGFQVLSGLQTQRR